MSREVFERALLNYDKSEAYKVLRQFLDDKNEMDFIEDYIIKSLTSIGDRWEKGEVALSQVYMSSKLCEEIAMSILPKNRSRHRNTLPIAIVTLEAYHTLGKRIVSAVVRSSGYDLKDYGSLTEPVEITQKIRDDGIKILMISVLMYPSALKVKAITQMLHEQEPTVKVLVGGAPFLMDSTLWQQVGADEMGKDAADTVKILERWAKEES